MRNKILYISQEISPYLPDSPMSLLGRKLPQGTQEKGSEVRTFMPKYGCINERRNQLHEVIRLSGLNVVIDDTDHPLIIKVATLQPARMQVYFIDCDDYFHHTPKNQTEVTTHAADNDERMMFFVRGVIETVKKLRWEPAVIHCTGWISALAPIYLKRLYADDPVFANSKVVYSLHNEGFDGTLDARFVEKLLALFSAEDLKTLGTEPVNCNTLNKLAIDYSDAVVAASEGVDQELMDYAAASGIPVLPFTSEEQMIDDFNQFYDTLLG